MRVDDYLPLSPDQARIKIRLMCEWIKRLGDDFSQDKLEQYEGLFTTLARCGAEPNWSKLSINLGSAPRSHKNEATAVSQCSASESIMPLVSQSIGKVCKSCHQEKALTEFYSHKGSRDGKHYSCKQCLRVKALATKLAA